MLDTILITVLIVAIGIALFSIGIFRKGKFPNTHVSGNKAPVSYTHLEEKNGKVWIGTDGGRINLYDPSTDKFTHFPSTYGDKVISIAEISESELMAVSYTHLDVYKRQTYPMINATFQGRSFYSLSLILHSKTPILLIRKEM